MQVFFDPGFVAYVSPINYLCNESLANEERLTFGLGDLYSANDLLIPYHDIGINLASHRADKKANARN
jgi:hypothetical protein